MQDFNEKLQYATGNLSEEGYTVTCNVEVEYGGKCVKLKKNHMFMSMMVIITSKMLQVQLLTY